MNTKVCRALMSVAVVTVLLGALPSLADGRRGEDRDRKGSRHVPEFDPTTVGAIAALLVGGGALLARRRR